MRQMDTILVAVGVPTREEAGAMSSKLQLVNLSQEKPGTPESAGQKRVKGEPSLDISNKDTPDVPSSNVDQYKKRSERKDSENGWDIPDISDLLDSISECEGIPESCQGSANSPCALGGENHVEPSQDQSKKDREDESNTEFEHTSWDWDTNWTAEHTNTTHQLHTEAQNQLTNGKPACSEPRWHFHNSFPEWTLGLDGKPHSEKLTFAATKMRIGHSGTQINTVFERRMWISQDF